MKDEYLDYVEDIMKPYFENILKENENDLI